MEMHLFCPHSMSERAAPQNTLVVVLSAHLHELHTFINCWCCFRGTYTDRARKKRLLHAKSYTRDAHKHRHWLNNNALFLMGQDYLNCDRTRHLASFSLVVLLRFKYMSPVVISNHFAPTNLITITVINYYYYYPTGTQ